MSWEYVMTRTDTVPTHAVFKNVRVKETKAVIKAKCYEYNDIQRRKHSNHGTWSSQK